MAAQVFKESEKGAVPAIADFRSGDKPYILVRFQDTGHGIARENLSRIFNPFFSTSPSGTGLGLPIVHKLVEKNRGYIFIDSVEDQGTQVAVLLPMAVNKEEE